MRYRALVLYVTGLAGLAGLRDTDYIRHHVGNYRAEGAQVVSRLSPILQLSVPHHHTA